MQIRPMLPADWPAVEATYRAGIATGNATFESAPPNWQVFDASRVSDARLVATDDSSSVIGWAAASRVSTRNVYRGVIEHSLYIAPEAAGRGVGRALLDAFVRVAEEAGYWTIQSAIFPENTASLRLHERAGFRRIGHRERIAFMTYGPWAGRWRDTVLVERRADATMDA